MLNCLQHKVTHQFFTGKLLLTTTELGRMHFKKCWKSAISRYYIVV